MAEGAAPDTLHRHRATLLLLLLVLFERLALPTPTYKEGASLRWPKERRAGHERFARSLAGLESAVLLLTLMTCRLERRKGFAPFLPSLEGRRVPTTQRLLVAALGYAPSFIGYRPIAHASRLYRISWQRV